MVGCWSEDLLLPKSILAPTLYFIELKFILIHEN